MTYNTSRPNHQKAAQKDLWCGRIYGLKWPNFHTHPGNRTYERFRPDPESMNEKTLKQYNTLCEKGLKEFIQVSRNQGEQNLMMSVKCGIPHPAFYEEPVVMTLCNMGERNTVGRFIEQFGDKLKNGETPIASFQGRIITRNDDKKDYYIHTSEPMEKYIERVKGNFVEHYGPESEHRKTITGKNAAPLTKNGQPRKTNTTQTQKNKTNKSPTPTINNDELIGEYF